MDGRRIDSLLGSDLSSGSEAFRDALLARCLDALDDDDEGIELNESELDLLVAAGDLFASQMKPNDSTHG